MMQVREIDNYDDQTWNDFVSCHAEGTIFHQTRWLAAITKTQGVTLLRLGFFEESSLIGVLPILRKGRGLFSVVASPFVVADTPYLGIVISGDRMNDATLALDNYLRKLRAGFLRIMQRQSIDCSVTGMITIDKTTHIVDVRKSEDELWRALEGRCRTAIRKAQKSGVTISRETEPEILDTYHGLLEKMYANQKLGVPQSKAFYQMIFEAFSGSSLYILSSRVDGEMVGGIILIKDGDRVYYLNGTSNPEFNHLNPNNLLLWEGMKLAKSLGAGFFDFVGSDIPRLAAFKKSFGGELFHHSCLEKAYLPGFTAIRNMYPTYKAIRGRFFNREEK